MMDDFEEFTTPIQEMSGGLHELFASFVDAGFTAAQAIYLVGQVVRASMAPTPTED